MNTSNIALLNDTQLLAQLKTLVTTQRRTTADIVAHLAEVDARKLYALEGESSLFTYCTRVLHLAEGAAYRRITVARLSRRVPEVLEYLVRGDVHLSALTVLAPHLTRENCQELLAKAKHRSKSEVELLAASLAPKPEVATVVRKLPVRQAQRDQVAVRANGTVLEDGVGSNEVALTGELAAVAPMATPGVVPASQEPRLTHVNPLSAEAYRVQFTADPETIELLRCAQDLLRHQLPQSDPAQIFKLALQALVEKTERVKCAAVKRSPATRLESKAQEAEARPAKPGSRHIPAAVRRQVWTRDAARCAYRNAQGHRCSETGMLEFHHVTAYARGGPATAENIELRCRTHNALEARLEFGDWKSRVREVLPEYGTRKQANSSWEELRNQN